MWGNIGTLREPAFSVANAAISRFVRRANLAARGSTSGTRTDNAIQGLGDALSDFFAQRDCCSIFWSNFARALTSATHYQ
jgi:hypothetical protein